MKVEFLLLAANVMQGKGTGVITDINGNFTIVADPNQPLTVSYIGFDSQQVKARAIKTI